MTLQTRRPTGKPPWPIILIAGGEKSGKSWACAQATSSTLVGRALWVGVGEDDPDEYAEVPGADFEIVEHDGTYRGILNALTAAVAEPRVNDLPTLIVVDSMTRLWNLLCDMAQQTANERAAKKGRATDEADISMDLWNIAKSRWGHIMDTLREHDGPTLLTARLDEVTVMSGGKPTTDKVMKVQAEKSLPYDVGAVVEMPERGKVWLKGVRSARLQLPERQQWNAFTVDEFWRRLGLDEAGSTSARRHSGATVAPEEAPQPPAPAAPPVQAPSVAEVESAVAQAFTEEDLRGVWNRYAPALTAPGKARLSGMLDARKAEFPALEAADVAGAEAFDQREEPAPVLAAVPDSSGPPTRSQLQQLTMRLTDLGVAGRQPCLDWISEAIGRTIASRNDLTTVEAGKAIDRARWQLGEATDQAATA